MSRIGNRKIVLPPRSLEASATNPFHCRDRVQRVLTALRESKDRSAADCS